MSELKTIDFIYFISHFYFLFFSFLFIFLFSDLELRFSMMLHITVTLGNCYCKHDTVWTANMLTGIKR